MNDRIDRPARKSPRLKDYDYAQDGAYFVTICTQNRAHLFGTVVDQEMRLNVFGGIVQTCWDDLVNHYSHIELDVFVVMPNHVHGIVVILNESPVSANREGLRPSPTMKPHRLTEIVRAFKSFSARRMNERRNTPGQSVWQRSFHDRIIRSEKECNILREYMLTNPARWQTDMFYSSGE